MLSPNKINLSARIKSASQGKARFVGVMRALKPFAVTALVALAVVLMLTLHTGSLQKKMQPGAIIESQAAQYDSALALRLERDSLDAQLSRLESLSEGLSLFPRYGSDAHDVLYSAAYALGVEIGSLSFDMEAGVATLSCTAAKPSAAAEYAARLGSSFSHVRYDGYTLESSGTYRFYIKCLLEKEGG